MNTFFEFVALLLAPPNLLTVVIFATVAGAASMLLYRRYSPQLKLRVLDLALAETQKTIHAYDGEFDGMWPLIRQLIGLSCKRVWMTLLPSVIAGIPLIIIMVCLDQCYSRPVPATTDIVITVDGTVEIRSDHQSANMRNQKSTERMAESNNKSEHELLAFGPAWMRSWVFLFLVVSTVAALAVRKHSGIR